MNKVASKNQIIAGLDIGTNKVALVIGLQTPTGVDIVGVGVCPSQGMRQGVVVNIEAMIESVRKAREEAELMAGYTLQEAWVSVSGAHIRSFDSKGMVAIKNREVTAQDVERVIEAAKLVAVPGDREVIHVLPREFIVDEQSGICDPVGMSGVRLESLVHIVTGGHTPLQNAVKCAELAGLKVCGLVLQPLASSLAVLSEDERNLGVAVVDMGGGTCDTIIYSQGSVSFTSVLLVGGHHFTHDVAVGLRTPQANAEKLKRKFGCALSTLVNDQETIEVEGVGGRKVRTVFRRHLCDIIEPRAEETLNLIHNELQKSGMIPLLGSGVVLTGGASDLDGLIEMADFVFDVPVRRGVPVGVGGLTDIIGSPAYTTAVGLILYGLEQQKFRTHHRPTQRLGSTSVSGPVSRWSRRIKDLFTGALGG